MLGELDLLTYYALFNLVVSLCSMTIIANILGKQISPKSIYLAVFIAIIITLPYVLFWRF